MRVDLVTVPYRYDEREEGLGAGPGALLAAGLVDQLRAKGVDVGDHFEACLDLDQRESGRTALNIGRLGAETARLVAAARRRGDGVLVLAGDDTAAIGVVSGLQQADGANARIGIVWVDAHGDFNTPETSYSGILAGMPVAILAGLAGPVWREAAELAAPIPTDRIVLAGTRELDDKERELIGSTDVRIVPAGELRARDRFVGVMAWLAGRCDILYLHIDLDVLDPRFVPSSSTPSADGLTIDGLVVVIATVLNTAKVAAVTLSSLNPGAGSRGQRSVSSAMKTLTDALPGWSAAPDLPVSPGA
jgi:arginase